MTLTLRETSVRWVKRLSDEELSRVLSLHAVGKLWHETYGNSEGCACVAGAALALWVTRHPELVPKRAHKISDAAEPAWEVTMDYPETPEALLQFLADRGLA